MQIDKKVVGEKIHDIRIKNNYSMEQFGKQIGDAPRGSVNSWEKGVNLPNKERLELIAIMGNMSVNELLYGSLNEYVSELLANNLGIRFSNQFIDALVNTMYPLGYSYGDDVKIIQMVNRFLSNNNVEERKSYVQYFPISDKTNLYLGKVNRNGELIPSYFVYSETAKNIVHIMPFFLNENVSDFYKAPSSLTTPKEHNYFSSDFLNIGIKLQNAVIVYYGINQKRCVSEISEYHYNSKNDCFLLADSHSIVATRLPFFQKEADKEILYLQQNVINE